MKDIPNVVQELRNFQDPSQRPHNVLQLLRTLADMQEVTLKRLTTTVEEERSRQELLEYYIRREEEASKVRAQLEKDLASIRREREKAQSSRTEVLTKLKADLLDVQESKVRTMRKLREASEARMNEHHETFNAKEEAAMKQIEKLKADYKNLKESS